MKISEPHEPKPTTYPVNKNRSAFRSAVEALTVGQALTMENDNGPARGNFRSLISSRLNTIGQQATPKRQFRTSVISDTEVQVTRTE